MTWSTNYAAGWAMRRAPQEGQNQRRSQLNATSLSWPQSPKRSRRKPWARMTYSRKVLISALGVLRPTGPVLVTAYLAKSQASSSVKQATLARVGAVVHDLAI